MKTRDFFILMVKLFGLYTLAISIFTYLPNNLSFLVSSFIVEDFTAYIISFLTLSFMLVLTYILMKKADKVVDLLKIDRGFNLDRIDLGKMSEATIVKIAMIILGTYLFVEELPYFINTSLNVLKVDTFSANLDEQKNNNFVWVFSLIKLFCGLFLMLNYKFIQENLFKRSQADQGES